MRRFFGVKKNNKSAQPSPIPTPIPAEEFRARAQGQPYPTPPAQTTDEPWNLVRDDASIISYERIHADLPALPPGVHPPSPGSNTGSPFQPPPSLTHLNSNGRGPPSITGSARKSKAGAAASILRSLDPVAPHQPDHSPPKSRSPSPESQALSSEGDRRNRRERDYETERQRQQWEVERDREIAREREIQRLRELEWEKEMEREREAMAQRARELGVDQRERERERERQREIENERARQKEREAPHKHKDERREKDKDKERKKFFGTSRDKDKDKEKGEVTRMIGYLTATASEDWGLVLDLCERASANDSAAREAAKALRREFKYAEPGAQLSAARLWAIMLRNCSPTFITAASAKKFLDSLEDVLTSQSTSPVVRERLMDVLAAAAYTHPGSPREGYRTLWKKVKPPNKPEEGIPFDDDEAMLNPAPAQPPAHSRNHSLQNQVIPIHEDMRRLFEECVVGRGNAQLLNQALTFAKPDELGGPVIREWYRKCTNSREFIMAQIPWATAQADRSRDEARRIYLSDHPALDPGQVSIPTTREEELLAALLGALEELQEAFRIYEDLERLGVAEEEEREVMGRSRKEVRMDRRQLQTQYMTSDGSFLEAPGPANPHAGGSSAGPSRSPSPALPSLPLPPNPPPPLPVSLPTQPSHQYSNSSLAPPHSQSHSHSHTNLNQPRPHGPRPPVRTPSPDLSLSHSHNQSQVSLPPALSHNSHIPGVAGTGQLGIDLGRLTFEEKNGSSRQRAGSGAGGINGNVGGKGKGVAREERKGSTSSIDTPIVPSAKAMGKRRAVDGGGDLDEHSDSLTHPRSSSRSSSVHSDQDANAGYYQPWRKQPVKYVYDAAADRARDIRHELGIPSPTVNRFPVNGRS